MLVQVWVRNDETGLLDDEFRDGDVQQTQDDAYSFGTLSRKAYLIIKIPDPPNMAKVAGELVLPEYAPPESTSEPSPVRRKRKYRLDWRNKFTEAEIALIEDALDMLPDGETAQGGTVVSGVVSGLFTIGDFIRK